MLPIYLDPSHPSFPPEPKLPQSELSARRRALTRWLWARLNELTGDCVIGLTEPEAGILEAVFPAMDGERLVPLLRERGVFCTVAPEGGVRFTLSAGQTVEPIDTLQAVLMNLLDIQ